MSDTTQIATPPTNKPTNHRIQRYFRPLFTAFIIISCLIGIHGKFDQYTHKIIDQSMIEAGVTFGTVKASSMLISKLKGFEAQLGPVTMRLGEILEPINETLVYTSHIIMMAIASLGIQKVLLGIFGSSLGNALLISISAVTIACLWVPRLQPYKNAAKRLFLITAFIRFSLALVVAANTLVDHLFLQEQIHYNEQRVALFESQLDELPEALDAAQVQAEEQEKGVWQRTKDKFGELTDSVSSMTDGIADMPERFNDFVINFMNIIALYLLKTILIPLGFLYGLKRVFMAILNIDLTNSLEKRA